MSQFEPNTTDNEMYDFRQSAGTSGATSGEPTFDDVVRLAGRLFDARGVVVASLGAHAPRAVAQSGLTEAEIADGLAYCARLAAAEEAPGEDGGTRGGFVAGTVLRDATGRVAGAIALAQDAAGTDLDEAGRAALSDLATLAAERLERQRLALALRHQQRAAALRNRLLTASAEAPDFAAAIAAAAEAFMDATGAIASFVFRLAPDNETVLRVHSSGRGEIGTAAYQEKINGLPMTVHNSQAGRVLLSNRQDILRDVTTLDLANRPVTRMAHEAGMVAQIVTPVSLPEVTYAFSVALPTLPEDIDDIAAMLAEAMLVLRVVLRRLHDEAAMAMFRRAIEVCPDLVMITEAEPVSPPGPRIVYVNPAFTKVTGYSAEEVIGRAPRLLQGEGTSEESRAHVRAALKAWQPVREEILNYRKDGTPIWLDMNIAPLADPSGWYTHWVSVERDTTAQRAMTAKLAEAAREMKVLISAMPGGLLRCRPDAQGVWRVTYATPAVAKITGYSQWDFKALRHHAGVDAADIARVHAHFQAAWDDETNAIEFPMTFKDGRRGFVHLASRANRRADGTPEVVTIATDVTEERERASALAQANRLGTLGEMATGLAHELGQPLAAITLNAEVAMMLLDRDEPDTAGARERIERMSGVALRAGDIIRNLREFAGRRDTHLGAVDLAVAVSKTRSLVERLLVGEGIALIVSIEDALPPVLGEITRIEQVLVNLLMNARDALTAAQPATAWVRVAARRDGARVRVEVSDNAGGIPGDVMGRVFDPFFTTKGPDRGTGLGLSIARSAMKTMKGEISVRNGADGAVFTLVFMTAA